MLKIKETNLFDIRIKMASVLNVIVWFFVLFSHDYFIRVVAGIFIANFPFLFFAIGINIDKGWVFSAIGLENADILKSKKYKIALLESSLGIAAMNLVFTDNMTQFSLSISAVVLGIFFALRTLTQVMGFYIYWIARISNDTEFKANIPDDLILEKSREAAITNTKMGAILGIPLLIFGGSYFFAEFFFSITSATRIFFYPVFRFFFQIDGTILCSSTNL